jgi:hypothetical protein
MLGIFILSLLTFSVMISIQMNEWEYYSYNEICYLTSRRAVNKHKYFKNFIGYKLSRVVKSHTVNELMRKCNEFKLQEVNHRAMIRSKLIISYTPLEFCERVINEWYDSSHYAIQNVKDTIDSIYPQLHIFSESTTRLIVTIKNSKVLMFKLYNLFKIVTMLNSFFEIESNKSTLTR